MQKECWLHSGGLAVIQTPVGGAGMVKRRLTARSRLDSGWLVGLSVCRPASPVWSRTGQNESAVPSCCCIWMARRSEGLNHFRLANDDPQNYPETG